MKYRKLIFTLTLAFICGSGTFAQEFKYVGAAKCKVCHNKPEKGEQYNKWANGPHAKALSVLSNTEAKDPKCIKCHSTAGGVDPKLIATLSADEGVSCESCHGPGSVYKVTAIMKNRQLSQTKGLILPDDKLCRKCHNTECAHVKGFDFAQYWAKINHDDPTRK